MCNNQEFISVTEVAKRLNVSPKTIYREIRDGKLNAIEIRNCVRITVESFNDYRDHLKKYKPKINKK